ncbi:MAG: hypothetical protein ABJL67_12720 [Sulfitobacter sp.]
MNDWIGDMRCIATEHVPQLRTDAASAKRKKSNGGFVRVADIGHDTHRAAAVNGRSCEAARSIISVGESPVWAVNAIL